VNELSRGRNRQDRLIQERDHDPYRSGKKLKSPTVCPVCNAVYLQGRWTWADAPEDAQTHVCPACQRIEDRVPAAYLALSGDFFEQHKSDILNLIHNYAERERTEHPLKRIMDSVAENNTLSFTLTDAHLARGIGEALQHAYEGELTYQYTKQDIMLRVTWVRM
jgi:hypothetical protein